MRICIIVLFSLLGISSATADGPTKAKPEPAKLSQNANQKPGDNNPYAAPPNSPITNQASAQNERQSQSIERSEWWIAVLTGLIALISVLQTAAFVWQGWLLRDTIKQMEVSEERQLRPYVFLDTVDIHNVADAPPRSLSE